MARNISTIVLGHTHVADADCSTLSNLGHCNECFQIAQSICSERSVKTALVTFKNATNKHVIDLTMAKTRAIDYIWLWLRLYAMSSCREPASAYVRGAY